MFGGTIELGKVLGIKIQLNWSLLIIFGLITFHLGAAVFPEWHPNWSVPLTWGTALAAAVVFFASLLLHELAHSVTARAFGVPVRSITLFLFGGVSNIEEEPKSAWMETVIAIVGPLTSLAIGVGFLVFLGFAYPGAAETAQTDPMAFAEQLGPISTILVWAGPINIILAIFNMIPAFPLDGGRILRATFWGITGDVKKATRYASSFSQVISWAFIAVGIAMVFGVQIPLLGSGLLGGIWIAIIGWFIGRAAKAAYFQQVIEEELADVPVERLMHSDVAVVSPDTTLERLVQQYAFRRGQEAFPVIEGDEVVGMIYLDDIRRVDRDAWSNSRVGDSMRSRDDVPSIGTDETAAAAFKQMTRKHADQLPVIDDHKLRGVIRQEDVMKWLELHWQPGRKKTA